MEYNFSEPELQQLSESGITKEEARRQLKQLSLPPYVAPLIRACTLGDGIVSLEASSNRHLLALHSEAAAQGRFTKFVPASGAASRMFRDLLSICERSPAPTYKQLMEAAGSRDKTAVAVLEFLNNIQDFAFFQELAAVTQAEGRDLLELVKGDDFVSVIRALVLEEGLNYSALPKGLLKFHTYQDGARTPFEEHLFEAVETIQDKNGTCCLHFTVSPDHQSKFESLLEEALQKIKLTRGTANFHVTFSAQKPSSDMLALSEDGKPFCDPKSSKLLLRPGGHGALIENLSDLKADIIYIKNIDNVQPDRAKQQMILYKKLLAGFLVETQRAIFSHLKILDTPHPLAAQLDDAYTFTIGKLGILIQQNDWDALASIDAKREFLISKLNRPLRVCGVVKNTGEPGGGPFWLAGKSNLPHMQIVEEVQVDTNDAAQTAILKSSTHFNPVDLVCGVRDYKGNNFDLSKYVDQNSTILSKKSHQGCAITVAERPGLWNGAMADWITIFVEVPVETFTPVKTVNDLLKGEHRA